MGNRYSREELKQIECLADDGLTNREISLRLGRSEAGIRNLRYRLNFKRRTKDDLCSLLNQKEELQSQIHALQEEKARLIHDVRSLEDGKANFEDLLNQDEESLKERIQDQLINLKIDKPELFYISGEEQLAKLVGYFFRWLLS